MAAVGAVRPHSPSSLPSKRGSFWAYRFIIFICPFYNDADRTPPVGAEQDVVIRWPPL